MSVHTLGTCLRRVIVGGCGVLCLIGVVSAAAVPSQAQLLASDAALDLAVWKKLDVSAPGVYEADGRVFSLASVSGTPKAVADRTSDRARNEAIRVLAGFVTARVKTASVVETQLLKLAGSASMKFSGRFLFTDCSEETCTSLFVTDLSAMDAVARNLDPTKLVAEGRRILRSNPTAHASFFFDVGVPDVALALQMRTLTTGFFNVKSSFLPTEGALGALKRFQAERTPLLKQSRRLQPSLTLAFDAVEAVEFPKPFIKSLESAGIPLLSWTHSLPILRQAALTQGFVKLDRAASAETPISMAFIKAKFSRGEDLALVTYMLENAAQRSPANPEVWEYLSAAYLASGATDAATVCARVWLSVSTDPIPALKYLLGRIHKDAVAAEAAQIFD